MRYIEQILMAVIFLIWTLTKTSKITKFPWGVNMWVRYGKVCLQVNIDSTIETYLCLSYLYNLNKKLFSSLKLFKACTITFTYMTTVTLNAIVVGLIPTQGNEIKNNYYKIYKYLKVSGYKLKNNHLAGR